MMKKMLAVVLAGAMVLSMSGCSGKTADDKAAGGKETDKADETAYKIGVLQLVQHTALDASREGFLAALDDAALNYVIDVQNAAGEQSNCQTMAEKLVNDKKDLILAIATPAAQAVAGMTGYTGSCNSCDRSGRVRSCCR